MPIIGSHTGAEELPEIIRIDRTSLESIFAKYFEPLVYFARLNLNDEDKAREVVSDVFLDLWEKREKLHFGNEFKLRSWLYKVTKGKAVSLIRESVKEQSELAELKYIDRAIHHPEEVDSALLIAEAIATIRKAVIDLPPRCRVVMELLLEGKTHEEIAELLDLRQDAVRQNKARAITLLQKRFNNQVLFAIVLLLLGIREGHLLN